MMPPSALSNSLSSQPITTTPVKTCVIMRPTQAAKAMVIFNGLDFESKSKLFDEMLNLGLRITTKQTTWHKHARQRAKTARGDVQRYFALLTNFTPSDVNVFFDSFTEHNRPKAVNNEQ